MNYQTLICILIGFVIGYFVRGFGSLRDDDEIRDLKILSLFEEKNKITNKDVQKLLDVSDTTAFRCLNNLEKIKKIKQIGETGKYTHYIKV